ncbi:YncE family protein [Streptosporangium sp. CA-135522]|uniref:YncE family protein n=1 Tax=Streptosporangium sp. CA-135522 TaxID=3240072 RepID=UPI003D8FA0C4
MQRLTGKRQRHVAAIPLIGLAACALSACGGGPVPGSLPPARVAVADGQAPPAGTASPPAVGAAAPRRAFTLPGALASGTAKVDLYAHDRPGMLSPVVARFPERIYVPNGESDTVTMIDPHTYRVLRAVKVGRRPQHVIPSWDLKTLWVSNDDGDSLTPINPMTGKAGRPVHVEDPYDLYFTLDGRTALVMAERENRLDFRDPRTMRLRRSLQVPCRGISHADFTADGTLLLASCESSGQLVVVDVEARKLRAVVDLADGTTRRGDLPHAGERDSGLEHGLRPGLENGPETGLDHGLRSGLRRHRENGTVGHGAIGHGTVGHGALRHGRMAYGNMPQDVKLSPDGTVFYVADMARGGVWLVDARRFRITGFIRTGAGARGLYVSRDSKVLYVSNRAAGSVTVVSFALRRPIDTWRIPGGGSPDMGGVSADGGRLWLSGRYDGVVYVFDTVSGHLIRKIDVGAGPRGLTVYPQPGRYSLGHTGIFR